MNKRIFSLVFIALYILLVVSIHCSEQKASDVGNKSVRNIKEINRGDERSGIKSKHETELNNKNNSDLKDDEGYKDDIDDKDYNDKISNRKYANDDDVGGKDVKGNKNSDYDGQWKPHGYYFCRGSNNMVMGYGFRPKF
ncbi:fam-c protein [Plasmodium vinckei]|uniref:Fam-c protein n=1 Tax=Plasmodium vinckei TaxID=5860 RepID=A0A6V7T437_PLAVN|nr:fam-c protein [Plasmodium vinckei]